ncbi:hypothetical protein Bhyg_14184 [Pseudolycoriella hygida]|uniref:F-box domain-containing protein n=1 Tax=Pseudolycoriella hygida TaxID=35572 RepID=A0A9Q0MPC4_9DIPT|nr:hypothetical protein Bhyg_14184 [Pseudolycoriella hygida]
MKFLLFCTIFFLATALAEEIEKPAESVKSEQLKAEPSKPKRQIVSLGYGHHAPYVAHASYVASAPIVHHAAPIVHHAAPLVHHAAYVAPYTAAIHHAAPIVSHAPIVHAASSYSISHQVHHPVYAHAPLISHAPLFSGNSHFVICTSKSGIVESYLCRSVLFAKMVTRSTASILCLDDMVLLQIATSLNIDDLINLGNTCKRFKYLAHYHLERRYRSVRWRKNGNAMKLCHARNIFPFIGKHLKAINLAYWSDHEVHKVLTLLATNCRLLDSITLDSIRMNRPFESDDSAMLSSMFKKLKQFSLKRCRWSGWCPLQRFFGENSTLEQLSIIDCCENDEIIYKMRLSGFTGLKELHLMECRNLLSAVQLQRCFENNDINILSFTNACTVNIFEQHLIRSLYTSVQSLTLNFYHGINFNQLQRLKSLKNLRLICDDLNNVDKFVSSVNPEIEQLEVVKIVITETFIEWLGTCTKLSHLTFESCYNSIGKEFFTALPKIQPNLKQLAYTYAIVTDYAIISMFKSLPTLRYLSLLGCNNLKTDTYVQMMEILTEDLRRPKLKFIPPQFESLKHLKKSEMFQKVIW